MVRTTRAALPLLRKATFARVVNVAASSIRHQSPGLIGFTAAKAASWLAWAPSATVTPSSSNTRQRQPSSDWLRE
jgi:NAD(P)-dependent dehydrogenase (short-subunit alcohol dehydrogenase family)